MKKKIKKVKKIKKEKPPVEETPPDVVTGEIDGIGSQVANVTQE